MNPFAIKPFLLFLLLMPAIVHAQKIALLDRGLKKPVVFTDSVSPTDIVSGLFPVYAADIDRILQKIDWFRKQTQARINNTGSDDIVVGHSKLAYRIEKLKGKKLYHLVLRTKAEGIETSILLVSTEDTNKRMLQKLTLFMDYLSDNLSGPKRSYSFVY